MGDRDREREARGRCTDRGPCVHTDACAHAASQNTVRSAKLEYSRPTGYATSSRWLLICSTVTNMVDAANVHQPTVAVASTRPNGDLYDATHVHASGVEPVSAAHATTCVARVRASRTAG